MGRTFSFGSNGRLTGIGGKPTGADEGNIVVADHGVAELVDNPNFDPSPDGPAAVPAPVKSGPAF